VVMDPALKESVIADLDRFLRRRDYYRRIGKAWKRGYLLYGPPGTGKSSLVAAMANYLRFNLYDLDPSHVHSNTSLQKLLTAMPNKSILVIEDIEALFKIQELLSEVEVTPAEVSEMLLRSEDPDVALQEFVEFLQDKKKQGRRTSK
ncbi:hypothetical protein BDA96_02G335400, partial [Sorghum bicolor]